MLSWQIHPFSALSPHEVYQIAKLRQDVFIIEQACFYHDLDDLDAKGWHCLGRDRQGVLIAYARLLPKGLIFEHAAIGRVLVRKGARGKGLARILMGEALTFLRDTLKESTCQISAQYHLVNFYASLGFKIHSPVYEEDGIPHIDMLRHDPIKGERI